ncbi:hypothetical protein ACFWPH_34680 [Nocardia sp. NPDC058499]|uniref:hypothetical protein n=1 Tax=Nocardia sp. NPDC058499 TaxID=3346530 RepID=UPI00365C0DF1
MNSFVAQARGYVGRYRDRESVLTHLGEMSGVEFDSVDHVLHFVNGDDEDLIFWQRPGETVATLLLSTQDWEPALVSLESLTRAEFPMPEVVRGGGIAESDLWTADDLGLSRYEVMWAAACFVSTRQADEEPEPVECEGCPSCTGEEHADIEADLLHEYILARILDRIEVEPDLVHRSISAMRANCELEQTLVAELGPLESDPHIVRQVNKLGRARVARIDDIEPEAFRLAVIYLIDRIYIAGPSLPLEEQVRIVWRVPDPDPAASAPGST